MINILAVCSSAFYMNNCVPICELSPHVIGLQHIKHMRRQHLWFGNKYRCYREPCLLDVTTLISSVQFLSRVQLFMTPWTAAHQASLSITNSWSLLKLMSIESVMPSNRLILCCPILLTPLIFPSIRVFSSESVLTSVNQSIGGSASALVLPMNIQDWFPWGLTGWISIQSKSLL